jgi:hypothetical protein
LIRDIARRLPNPVRAPLRRIFHAIVGAPTPPPPSRKDILLSGLDHRGLGLEIGPAYNPAASRREGFRVETVDLADRDALVAKYTDQGVDIDAIEDVDFVWSGGSLVDRTGRRSEYDWIIASHVIEHVPDLVGFLNDCDAMLRAGGVLSLAVPDKRYCFDRMRAATSIQALVDAHFAGLANHTPGRVADYYLNVVSLGGKIGWRADATAGQTIADLRFIHGAEQARDGIRAVNEANTYFDIHAWCFIPHSFRLLMDDLYRLGLIRLRESFFLDRETEFFVRMSREGEGPGMERMELLRRVEEELAVPSLADA